ncbi:MAG: 16S rRNA (uracil(1498)-N(3))-methyltransferase [Marmoricola sp.]
MSLPVFLHPELGAAAVGGRVTLTGDEGRHAAVVRRIRSGEQIEVVDGAGIRLTCEVEDVTKTSLHARVLAVRHESRRAPRITVVQAIPKGDRAELAVEVLTEIGVDTIVPWAAARSVGVWRGERAAKSLAKWRSAAREAAKQSRRAWFPEVTEMATTADVVALLQAADSALVLHEDASVPITPIEEATNVVLVVGPEGGIAPEELEAFAHAQAVRLGPTVLRTSTAGVAAVAALLSGTPRWS